MKRFFALILALSLLLCACGGAPAETTAPVVEETVPTEAEPEETVPEENLVVRLRQKLRSKSKEDSK